MEVKPQWIAKMYPGKAGRDHLGLGSVSSNQILQAVSPGIYVLTFHPRYYSFYAFLLDEFWKQDRARTRKSWISFYRPREFIYSLGTHLCQLPEHGDMGNVVGSEKTGPLANRQLETYNTNYPYIESPLGGYGLYYRTVMAELGLIYLVDDSFNYRVDVPTEKGKKVAEAFRRTISETRYYREYFGADEIETPIDVIRDYIHQACLCQLRLDKSADKPLLLDIFLHDGLGAKSRRSTLRMLLDIANQTQGSPINQDSFRQLINSAKPMREPNILHWKWSRIYISNGGYIKRVNITHLH